MATAAQGILFSLSDLAIKKPSDTVDLWVDIPYAMEASYKGSHQTVDLYGDDAYQDSLDFNQKGELTIKATKAVMAVLEKVTGGTATSSSSNDEISIHLAAELDPPIISVKATARFIKDDGTKGDGILYLYKCKCSSPYENFLSFANGKVSEMTLTFRCMSATVDYNNVALGTACFGRLVLPRP